MKTIPSSLFCVCLVSLILNPAFGNQEAVSLDKVKAHLSSNTLYAFVSMARREGWCPPAIYSQWHVNRMSNQSKRALEEKNREFGKLVLIRVLDTAGIGNTVQSSSIYYTNAIALLRIGEWLGRTPGYENYLLSYRCVRGASFLLAKMACDLSCPLSNITECLPLSNMPWYRAENVADILNMEAGNVVVLSNGVLPSPSKHALVSLWSCTENPQWLTGMTSIFTAAQCKVLKLNSQFFHDDNVGFSTSTWTNKLHIVLVMMIPDAIFERDRQELLDTIKYREVIGFFPTNDMVRCADGAVCDVHEECLWTWSKDRSLREGTWFRDAFVAEWRHRLSGKPFTKEDCNLCTRAAIVYERMWTGYYYDVDRSSLMPKILDEKGRKR